MADQQQCPICFGAVERYHVNSDTGVATVDCPRCGRFAASDRFTRDSDALTSGGTRRWVLSGAVRERDAAGADRILLNVETARELLASARPPRNGLEGVDRLLQYIHDRAETPTDYVALQSDRDYPLVYGKKPEDFKYYLSLAQTEGYLASGASGTRLLMKGWQRLDDLKRQRVTTDQAFVAMWFDQSMDALWIGGIQLGLADAGYRGFRVDAAEHNGKIDDLIVAEIGKSALLVADFTGHRGGVYFEAGFALGLGLPVIWMCREDEVGGAHFDTRQFNHIVWKAPEDARDRLRRRIEATFPRVRRS